MTRSLEQLRRDALAIWQAGVAAVDPRRLMAEQVLVEDDLLFLGDAELLLADVRRLVVVGAGKAGASMAEGLLGAIPEAIQERLQLNGWINVPDDCARTLPRIHLHPARPHGCNEPTAAGVYGTQEILARTAGCGPSDVCLVLLSGGGSALLPAPPPGVSLEAKVQLARLMSAAGASIQDLNLVRRQVSLVKGGGLLASCGAGHVVTLTISDVLGDPVEMIASGPTELSQSDPSAALATLKKHQLLDRPELAEIVACLRKPMAARQVRAAATHTIIGNLAVAVDAAGLAAEKLGYSHAMVVNPRPIAAEEEGRHLAQVALRMQAERGPDSLISGGEPTVTLPPTERRGRGGRNQQLALAALCEWQQQNRVPGILLSGGTDGEDGPTPAAGAWVDAGVMQFAKERKLSAANALARCDAYPYFEQTEGLLVTGPTHTNVCDLRVVLVEREELR